MWAWVRAQINAKGGTHCNNTSPKTDTANKRTPKTEGERVKTGVF